LERNVKRSSASVSALEAHLGYWLRYVSNQVSSSFAERLSGHDVTVAEWVALRELYDRPVAPSELAEKLGMTRGAISKIADRLIGKSLLLRKAGKDDRRYQELALTASGRTLVPKLAALADENDAAFFGHLKPAERKTIERIMKNIVRRHGLRTVPTE
jgi:DNA-binding MarR family transcriptional regulator